MLLFGIILLLNLTDLAPYTVIWPILLFGIRKQPLLGIADLNDVSMRFYFCEVFSSFGTIIIIIVIRTQYPQTCTY